jgi:hypothetical protein
MPACGNALCPGGSASSAPAVLCCSACGEVYYCSKDCQKADWKGAHKFECWRTKFSAITRALELSLFGVNRGGDPRDQLARIEALLEQRDGSKAVGSIESDKRRASDLLTATYVPPIVSISLSEYAVFSPFTFHGCYGSYTAAQSVLLVAYLELTNGAAPPDDLLRRRFRCSVSKDGSALPALSWAEHALIAVYISRHRQESIATDDDSIAGAALALTLNKPLELPRSAIPSGTWMPVIVRTADGISADIQQSL